MTGFPESALRWLRCPHCGGSLSNVRAVGSPGSTPGVAAGSASAAVSSRGPVTIVGCERGHRFDVARHGYLPLLGPRSRTDTGDDARMVAARETFLAGGRYGPIAAEVAAAVAGIGSGPTRPVIEVGAGTGYYLSDVCAATRRPGLALDASKYALRRAARQAGVAAVLADAWSRLPVRDGVAGAVLDIFAPRDPAELVRITAPGGRVVVVTPEPDHLAELRGPLPLLAVDPGKAERLVDAFAGQPVEALGARPVRLRLELPRPAVAALVAMGPTARHLSADALTRAVAALEETTAVTASVTVTILQRTASPR